MHGGQIGWVALHQSRRQLTVEYKLLRAISVGHDAFKQLHALHHAGFNLLPVLGVQHERKQVKRPGPLRLVGGGIDVVSDAVVMHLPLQVGHAGVQVRQ